MNPPGTAWALILRRPTRQRRSGAGSGRGCPAARTLEGRGNLLQTLITAPNGGLIVNPELQTDLASSGQAGTARRNRRKPDVPKLTAEAAYDKRIARRLKISADPRHGHLKKVFNKLDIDNRADTAVHTQAPGLTAIRRR